MVVGLEGMVIEGHLGGYVRGGDPATWCPNLWRWVIEERGVRSILDIGCGEGRSTKFFLDQGADVLGVEGASQAINGSLAQGCVIQHDYSAGPFDPGRAFDMAWCCEFLEHVEQQHVPNFMATFARANLVLATHAFPGQRGHHHVHCRKASYWIELFQSAGLRCDVRLTLAARRNTLSDHHRPNHFARSGLVFVRESDAVGKMIDPYLEPGPSSKAKALLIASRSRLARTFSR